MAISYADIKEQYQRILGRDPRPSEVEEFQKMERESPAPLQLGAEGIGRILESLPEARIGQLQKYGKGYEGELAKSDQFQLGQAEDYLRSSFAQQGRQTTSSAYVSAFANAARDLAMNRQAQLSGFYGQGYGDIFGQQGATGLAERARGIANVAGEVDYGRQKSIYYQQKNNFNDYLNAQNRRNRNRAMVGAGMGLAGAGLGLGLGAGAGLAGASLIGAGGLGAGLGGAFGGFAQ